MKLIILVLFLFCFTTSYSQDTKGKFSVGGVPNILPVVFAGIDEAITLPTNSTTLSGTASDADGIISYQWSQSSGPGTSTIATPLSATTDIDDLVAGSYVFRLSATDSKGGVGFDYVIIMVNSTTNISPISNAGVQQSITLPVDQVVLNGSASFDLDGTITDYLWERVSGTAGQVIVSPTSAQTAVTGLTAGTYVFRLTVTDNLAGTGMNNVTIIVNASAPVNVLPIADAGANQVIIQ